MALGNDHAGAPLRSVLLAELARRGIEVLDCGASGTKSVDYPDYARLACQYVAEGRAERAVLVCATGVGMSIAANKIKGIRCALCGDEKSAEMSRRHNDTNAIALRRRAGDDDINRTLLGIWLETPFDGGERHERHVDRHAVADLRPRDQVNGRVGRYKRVQQQPAAPLAQ